MFLCKSVIFFSFSLFEAL